MNRDGLPILIVDDDPHVRQFMTESLARQGLQAETVDRGEDALARFSADRHGLVFCDVKLPDVSGMDVLRHVKSKAPGTPVIMITGFGSVANAVEAMQCGAVDYLMKPFSIETLQLALHKAGIDEDPAHLERPAARSNYRTGGDRPIVTNDANLLQMLKLARSVAPSQATVMIQGESGTGKELLARYIHQHGDHPEAPYVAVNCAAMPDTLAESELFGYEKGAFTGALNRKAGKFEQAGQGTIVLDEISEMSLSLQAKLLRVLQERQVDRVGGERPVPIQARVIAISNVDLKRAVQDHKFRKDLYYRINVVPLLIPALRHRRGDIALLANHFLHKYSRMNHRPDLSLSETAIAKLSGHHWEGNVRELENTIERAVLICCGSTIQADDLILEPSAGRPDNEPAIRCHAGITVREMEKKLICKTLSQVNQNRTRAAKLLGISIRTLRNKLREYKDETQVA